MHKQEIPVKCFFQKTGVDLHQIISRSFALFLRQNLENNSGEPASPDSSGISCP